MVAVEQRVSVEEYLAIPESRKPYLEFMDGEVREKAMGDLAHGGIVSNVTAAFELLRRRVGGACGPEIRCEFRWDGREAYLLPDCAYWTKGRPLHGLKAALPPLVAVEVRSPDETMAAQREECRFYRDHGVRDHGVEIAWLIDRRSETVEVYEGDLNGAILRPGDVLRSLLLPGFELPVADLFVPDED